MLTKDWSGWLMALSVLAGLSGLGLAFCEKNFAAFVAVVLSVLWSGLAAGLLALRSSARRARTLTHERVVDSARSYLVQELEAERDPDAKGVPNKAELVDRLHGLALKALDDSGRRP